ncbi:MAG: PhnD/SsuA/transferrin family substrate-binding protein [Paracoccaceae bacterium]|nr:PhnD/SsuA/transferrin family substrate-binding protein [Paracoccaceae bacterium]
MIADLPMYDWPGVRAANDALWAEVTRRLDEAGIEAPRALARAGEPREIWRDPDLLLSQTCGMPYVAGHCGAAVLVGRPDYGLEGANEGTYRSAIVVRRGDESQPLLQMQGCRVAINEPASYSGHIALRAHLADLRDGTQTPFFSAVIQSGRHIGSARLVAEGKADLAALDWVAWELLLLHEPGVAERLAVIDRTAKAPALPFVTAPGMARHRRALARALDQAARSLPPVTGVPRAAFPTDDGDYDATRDVVRRAHREPFAPDSPEIPALAAK